MPVMRGSSELRALILDVGGVVMDELPTYRRFRRGALARLPDGDSRAVLQALRAAIRNRAPRASRHALQQLGGHEDLAAEIWAAIGNVDRPYPEADAALTALSRRYRLALLGNQGSQARSRLGAAGLLPHFDVTILSAEVGLEKPDPAIFRLALDELAVAPGEAAMVGDRLDLDIGPAKRLGMRGVRMLRGPHIWQRPVDEYERPDLTVRSLLDLARRLAFDPDRGDTAAPSPCAYSGRVTKR